jgi:hypothetical protein
MLITRREFVAIGLAATTHPARVISSNRETMYGLIGRMKAVPGQRDAEGIKWNVPSFRTTE